MLLVLVLLGGCGYDNTMYNARKYFKMAQNETLNDKGKPNTQAVDYYTKTIKKCGVILTERKNSPEADDAMFLLAKALYYKGNSQFQAKDQFESLRINFPDSPFAPEAVIYLALIYRQINQPQEAINILEGFIRQPENKTYHAKALFVLSDFAIQDKNYLKAQYWLDKILTDYPKTKEFKEAFFLSGKLWYEQKDYQKSLEQFQRLEKARRIDKIIVLDARYYIALNQMLLGKNQPALSTIKKLISEEYRLEKLPLCNVLKARIWLAMGKEKEGRELLETTIKASPRSLASAEAYYWLAEYDFLKKQDIEKAVENYPKPKNEFATSQYAHMGTSRFNAVSLIQQTAALNPTTDLQLMLDNNLQIAENYFQLFELPDSVFSVFRHIETLPTLIKVYEDSLKVKSDSLKLEMDSLAAYVDTTQIDPANTKTTETNPTSTDKDNAIQDKDFADKQSLAEEADSILVKVPSMDAKQVISADTLATAPLQTVEFAQSKADSLVAEPTLKPAIAAIPDANTTKIMDLSAKVEELPSKIDSLYKNIDGLDAKVDSLSANPDSLFQRGSNPDTNLVTNPEAIIDSLAMSANAARSDSLTALKAVKQAEYDALRVQKKTLDEQLKSLIESRKAFVENHIPYSLFVKASMVKRGLADSTMLVSIYDDMLARYPQNKYTNALRMLLAGEAVRLVDPAYDRDESLYDLALGDLTTKADSAIVVLDSLTQSTYPIFSLKANFRLGWLYTFESQDTTKAKPYLNEVMKSTNPNDYKTLVGKFYTGTKFSFPEISFTLIDSLIKQMSIVDSTTAASLSDSLSKSIKADSLSKSDLMDVKEKQEAQNLPELKEHYKIEPNPYLKPEETPLPDPAE